MNNLSLDIVVVVTRVEKCWPAVRENHFKISHNLVLNVGHLFSKFLNFCQSHLIDDAYVFYFFAFNWLLLALIEVFETKKLKSTSPHPLYPWHLSTSKIYPKTGKHFSVSWWVNWKQKYVGDHYCYTNWTINKLIWKKILRNCVTELSSGVLVSVDLGFSRYKS